MLLEAGQTCECQADTKVDDDRSLKEPTLSAESSIEPLGRPLPNCRVPTCALRLAPCKVLATGKHETHIRIQKLHHHLIKLLG
jgi:hypothetical protein